MKSFISVVCALFILGCSNDSTPTNTTSESTTIPVEENITHTAPTENSTPAEQTTPTTSAVIPKDAHVNGETIFNNQKCVSCHGSKAEKSALGKSQIIAGWKEDQVKTALKGYQAGTYGKEMKAVMQGQAKALNDEQIDALAKYISNL
jgi:mono/diheme cytochrome c family protein